MVLLKIILVLLVSCSTQYFVESYTFHYGQCPDIAPMSGFSMEKFLGKWYAIQQTSTFRRCLEYNFKKAVGPNSYKLDEMSEYSYFGLSKPQYYHYVSNLVANPSLPSKMAMTSSWSVFGDWSFVVFSTDYKNYAAVYICQKVPLGNRHYVTILSRSRTLDKKYLEKVRNIIAWSYVNPFDLTFIDQKGCSDSNLNSVMNVKINEISFHKDSNSGKNVLEGGKNISGGSDTKKVTDNDSYWA